MLNNKEKLKMSVWDTAGQEKFRAIMGLYYRDAQAAILVYDVTSKESLLAINMWIEELSEKVQNDKMILKLVGNKIDIPESQWEVSESMARDFAKKNNLLFGTCSALTGEGVKLVFQEVIDIYVKNLKT